MHGSPNPHWLDLSLKEIRKRENLGTYSERNLNIGANIKNGVRNPHPDAISTNSVAQSGQIICNEKEREHKSLHTHFMKHRVKGRMGK